VANSLFQIDNINRIKTYHIIELKRCFICFIKHTKVLLDKQMLLLTNKCLNCFWIPIWFDFFIDKFLNSTNKMLLKFKKNEVFYLPRWTSLANISRSSFSNHSLQPLKRIFIFNYKKFSVFLN
jgi:hypothetical protein